MDDYEAISLIGRGSFGTVSKIKRKVDGKILVWKEMDYKLMSDREKSQIVSEVNILRELRHPHIVRYYDRIIDRANSRIYIVMEYLAGGDLQQLIKRRKHECKYFEEEWIWRLFIQIVLALKECHSHTEGGVQKPILHRDLKPGNLMLDSKGLVKLGDFGLARELSSTSRFATTYVGTPFYMSPEMVNEQRYDERSDVWALGCLLYELTALRPPFQAGNQLKLAVRINDGRFSRLPPHFSSGLYDTIRWLLNVDINKRPSIRELEKLTHVRPYLLEYKLNVREFQVSIFIQKYNARRKLYKEREMKLKQRDKKVMEMERWLHMKERETRSS